MILLDESIEKLKDVEDKINQFLEMKLDLELNLYKTKLQPIVNGIDFLGYFVKYNYVLVRKRVVAKFKKRLLKCCMLFGDKGDNITAEDTKTILAMLNSYYGHFCHASTFNLRKSIYEKGLGGGA